jgi:menaquinone-dependent protoporphyrinogen IX oxidase
MKIGIIVHSQTGNTYSVAEKLKEKLQAAGHSVNIERIAPVGEQQQQSPWDVDKIQLEKLPDLGSYDALIFGAPVQAFRLPAVMAAYMKKIPSLGGKKVALFVTKGLPFHWTGGNKAISTMRKAVESRGGKVAETGIIVWSKNGLEKNISGVVEKLGKAF